MQHLNFDHQSRIFDPMLARPVTVIGAGSVGSHVVDTLARIGCRDGFIEVWDDDEVSSHNVVMSVYRQSDILRLKVDALAEIVKSATGVTIVTHAQKYTGTPLKTAIVACVDSIDERKVIWKQVKHNPLVGLFVDTRIAEEYVEVFVIRTCDTDDCQYYDYFVRYSFANALQPTCGNHGVKYISATAANRACAALTLWWKGGIPKRHFRMLCGDFQEV